MTIDTIVGTRERVSQLVGNLETLATLPEVVAKITETVNDPRSTSQDLHRIISHDPALVSRILQLVNSAFYSRAVQIDSVERAITLLGFHTIHHLAIAATLGKLFKGKLSEGYSAKDLWTHCIAVAVTAREMAKHINADIAEEVFLAGLVHDIGLLGMMQTCRHELRTICERAKTESTSFHIIELDVVGVDHQELGAAIAQKWGFPASCRAVARHHHHPLLAPDQWQEMAALVNVADALCCQQGIGFDLTARDQMEDEMAFRGLVPLRVIESVRAGLHELVEPAIRILGN